MNGPVDVEGDYCRQLTGLILVVTLHYTQCVDAEILEAKHP